MNEIQRMKGFARQIRRARLNKGWTIKLTAKKIGINKSTYMRYEYGEIRQWTMTAARIKNSPLFDRTGRTIELSDQRVRIEDRLITNIPDFYERLDELCNENGNIVVDVNDPRLQELRVAVGGKKVISQKSSIAR